MKTEPRTEPDILPRLSIMIIAIYSMDSHKVNGSGVILIM